MRSIDFRPLQITQQNSSFCFQELFAIYKQTKNITYEAAVQPPQRVNHCFKAGAASIRVSELHKWTVFQKTSLQVASKS